MTELLKRIGLVNNLNFELQIDKSDFLTTLKTNIDNPQSDFFDVFSRSKNVYKGIVSDDGFELKRKRRFFDMNMNFAKAKGEVVQTGIKLNINIEINSFNYFMIPFLIFGIVIYSFFIISILAGNTSGNMGAFSLPFILIHASLMFGIPYFIMRRSLNLLKYDIERDIFYMMKNNLNHKI